jgi:quercetin dioxygenase-like cupin family protein
MEHRPKKPTNKGPAELFTGDVWIDPITQGDPPSKLNIGAVHFTPGARTAWHSHNGGQTLYVPEGRGLVQSRGGQAIESSQVTSSMRRAAKSTGTEPPSSTS